MLGTAGWNRVIDLGDMGLILPAFVAALLVLAIAGRFRDAACWAAAFAGCGFATALMKGFYAGFPSGHMSMSAVFYGGLALMSWRVSHLTRAVAVGLALVIAFVGVAVLVLRWHPLADVIAGLALGSVLAWVGLRHAMLDPKHLAAMLVAAGLVGAALHGTRLDVSFASPLVF
jgi:membrane-associated phospholipid phosphatase